MNTPKNLYERALYELECQTKNDKKKTINIILAEKADTLFDLFNEIHYLGFQNIYSKTDDSVKNSLLQYRKTLTDISYPLSTVEATVLYLATYSLIEAFLTIKTLFENNLTVNIASLEEEIYKNNDYKTLIDALRNLERKIINEQLHSSFRILAPHINTQLNYLKNYKHFQISLQPKQINQIESKIKNLICKTIENIDKKGWQYAFVYEQDYNLFTDLLTNFFECKPYTLPKTIIQLKRNCKTKVAAALGEIHRELSTDNQLTNDKEYFEITRVLSHFEKETRRDLYKALTR